MPYAEFRPEFTDLMDRMSRNTFDADLIDHTLPLAPGLPDLRRAEARGHLRDGGAQGVEPP